MIVLSLLAAVTVVPPGAARSEDYLIVFAADSAPYRATKAHTFAAVVRVETGPGGPPRVADLTSLSWLPEAGTVRPLALRPEAGRNVPLDETLRTYTASGGRVTAWGPYRVRPEFAEAFRARVAVVESTFRYRAASRFAPPDVCDCARSVGEMVGPRRYIGVFGYGAVAAGGVVRTFSPWVVDPERSHPWVASLVGLDGYPLAFRPFGDYPSRLDQLRASVRR